ncbi:hypothetical protein ACFL6X_06955 [Candidatus Latescibacterota bacterium]
MGRRSRERAIAEFRALVGLKEGKDYQEAEEEDEEGGGRTSAGTTRRESRRALWWWRGRIS